MNSLDFVCSQLLSFEMMKQCQRPSTHGAGIVRYLIAITALLRVLRKEPKPSNNQSLSGFSITAPKPLFRKASIMENQLLIIVLLLVGLLANMTVMSSAGK